MVNKLNPPSLSRPLTDKVVYESCYNGSSIRYISQQTKADVVEKITTVNDCVWGSVITPECMVEIVFTPDEKPLTRKQIMKAKAARFIYWLSDCIGEKDGQT